MKEHSFDREHTRVCRLVGMPLFSTPKRARAADDTVSGTGQEDLRTLVSCWRLSLSRAFCPCNVLPCSPVRMH